MNNYGRKAGIEASYTAPLPSPSWYFTGEGRYARGTVDYRSDGSGTANDQRDEVWEIRGLVGKDFVGNTIALSPYTGYAFRYLYNDARGTSSLGAAGYRRQSTYQYIPLGVTTRFRVLDQSRISANIEYDVFTSGTQKSYLSDVNPIFIDLVSHQHQGMGARGSLLFENKGWAAGPWFNYWHIGESEGFFGANEPNNKTREVGFKITKKIW